MHFRQICDQPEASASGIGARFGGSANLDAFTETRWVTIRRDIAAYPF